MKWLKRTGLALAALIVIVALALGWLLGSQAGLRFMLARGVAASGGSLSVQSTRGHLAGPFELSGVRYHDAAAGVDVRVDHLQARVRIWPLLLQRAHIINVAAQGVQVFLTPPTHTPPRDPTAPFSLQAPLDITVDRVHVSDIQIRQGGEPVFVADTLDLAGAWTTHGIDLRHLRLRAPDGEADLAGRLVVAPGYSGDSKGSFSWTVDEQTWAGQLTAHSDGQLAHLNVSLTRPMKATLALQLTQKESFPWTAELTMPRFDPQALLGDGSLSALALNLHGSGDRNRAKLQGKVQINDIALRLQSLVARFDHDQNLLTLEQLTLTSPEIKGVLHASGTVQLDAHPASAKLAINWRDVVIPAELAGQVLASNGNITLQGSVDQWHTTGSIDIGRPDQLAHLDIDVAGTPRQIAVNTLTWKQTQGGMHAKGTLILQPQLAWDFTATAEALDPGKVFHGWDGAMDFDLATQGHQTDSGPAASLRLNNLGGTLRHHRIGGKGQLTLHPNGVVEGTLALHSGQSRVDIKARGKERNHIDLTLRIAQASDWLPEASGSLTGQIHVNGLWPKLGVNADLQGSHLSYADSRLAGLTVHVESADVSHPGGSLHLRASDVMTGHFHFAHLAIDGQGNAKSHHLRVEAQGEPLSLTLALDGRLQGKQWAGTLDTLDLAVQGLPPWRLQAPSRLTWDGNSGSLAQTCLSAGDPLLCVSGSGNAKGKLSASYRLQDLPLALLTTLASGSNLPLRGDGVINGEGTLTRSATGVLGGQAQITSAKGVLYYGDNTARPLLDYRNLGVTATLEGDETSLHARADFSDGGRLLGDVRIRGPQQALSGQIDARLASLAFFELFSTEVANVKGRLDMSFSLAGTLAQPLLGGQAVLDGFAAEIPGLGLKLRDGHIVALTGDGRQLSIDGRIQSGEGTLTVSGTTGLGEDAATRIAIVGNKVTLVAIPSATLVVSPALSFSRDASGITLNGKLDVDRGNVKLEKLPGTGATQASADVVVLDAEHDDAEKAQALPITTYIAVDFGKDMHIVGYGLDGMLSGQLNIRDVPGRFTTGQGQLSVDGTFRAYGQDLHISRGRLLFAGTPIDNPGLNIRAIRKLNPNATIDEGDMVGLQITGTAKHPVLTVFSKPAMEQSDALSYLITGKPLSQVKGGEGSMVGAAAQALGSAAGDLLAKSIGSKLGIDDIGVSNNEALGTSAFTVGKYLSPRLYLSYGVGLFEPGQVITLRYILSSHWNFEAQQATDFSRASFNYRIEK